MALNTLLATATAVKILTVDDHHLGIPPAAAAANLWRTVAPERIHRNAELHSRFIGMLVEPILRRVNQILRR